MDVISILLICCCITNHPNLRGLKQQPFVWLTHFWSTIWTVPSWLLSFVYDQLPSKNPDGSVGCGCVSWFPVGALGDTGPCISHSLAN